MNQHHMSQNVTADGMRSSVILVRSKLGQQKILTRFGIYTQDRIEKAQFKINQKQCKGIYFYLLFLDPLTSLLLWFPKKISSSEESWITLSTISIVLSSRA